MQCNCKALFLHWKVPNAVFASQTLLIHAQMCMKSLKKAHLFCKFAKFRQYLARKLSEQASVQEFLANILQVRTIHTIGQLVWPIYCNLASQFCHFACQILACKIHRMKEISFCDPYLSNKDAHCVIISKLPVSFAHLLAKYWHATCTE